jgi:glycosyltransferase involved in cell wall biosynthesis
MLVSVVVCSYDPENYSNLIDTVNSLLKQGHSEVEIIVVIDGSVELYKKLYSDYGSCSTIKCILLEQNVGLSAARNIGIKNASGEIIFFTDDDVIADADWIKNVTDTYEEYDALSVGGKTLPKWDRKEPQYISAELYWLFGVTYDSNSDETIREVRNTYGCNMSFKKQVFDKIGGFNEKLGFAKQGKSYIQAEETEFALRMRRSIGQGVIYNPRAIVYHKIPKYKYASFLIMKRAFYQGYSKAILSVLNITQDSIDTEKSYLKILLFKSIPKRILKIYRGKNFIQLLFIISTIFYVTTGYIYGYLKEKYTAPH